MGEDNNAVMSEGVANKESIDSIVREGPNSLPASVRNPLLHMVRRQDVAEWRYGGWPYRLTDTAEQVLANSPRVIERTFSPGYAQGYSGRVPLPSEKVRIDKVLAARKAWQEMIDGAELTPVQKDLVRLYNIGVGVLGTIQIWDMELNSVRKPARQKDAEPSYTPY